jgi:hypothetical protein
MGAVGVNELTVLVIGTKLLHPVDIYGALKGFLGVG